MLMNLQHGSDNILSIEDEIIMGSYKIALIIKEISDRKLYLEQGYKNVEDYVNVVFGYKKSHTSDLLRISEKFINEDGTSWLRSRGGRYYTTHQLKELLHLTKDEIYSLNESGKISYYMSTRTIREIVCNFAMHWI